ncbi:MAG: energy transducer TonB [Bacteroidales bacterium]|nr:energy transducer TonB [Bacteroidales bacterium]
MLQKGCGGKLYVQFIVNTTGHVENVNILAGFDNEFDQEAIRVITLSPRWEPAKQSGRAVKQLFTIPIIFSTWPKK